MFWKRALSLFLSVLLLVAWTTPALAIDGPVQVQQGNSGQSFYSYATELAEKYAIHLVYDVDENDQPAIDSAILAMLDTALGYVTPSIVRQVSAHYYQTTGNVLTFAFVFTPFQTAGDAEVVGVFVRETAVVQLFMPYNSANTFTTGASPLTIVHEFAHALHFMCMDILGEATLEQEWVSMNAGAQYTGYFADNYNEYTFVTDYGATSYQEDFAEVFSHAYVRIKAGQGFTERLVSNGFHTPLGDKVLYMESLLPRVFSDTEAAINNLRRVFSTPTALAYNGMLLSGEDLQFIGFSPPRYVLRGIAGAYGLGEVSSTWIGEIGGWQAASTDGGHYLIFPGGTVVPLQSGAGSADRLRPAS